MCDLDLIERPCNSCPRNYGDLTVKATCAESGTVSPLNRHPCTETSFS